MIRTFFAILFNISINVTHMIEYGIIIKTFCLQCYQENCQYFLSSIILYLHKINMEQVSQSDSEVKQKWRMLEVQVNEYQTGFLIQKLNIYVPVKQNFSFQFFDKLRLAVSLVKSAFSDFNCAMKRGTEPDLVENLNASNE